MTATYRLICDGCGRAHGPELDRVELTARSSWCPACLRRPRIEVRRVRDDDDPDPGPGAGECRLCTYRLAVPGQQLDHNARRRSSRDESLCVGCAGRLALWAESRRELYAAICRWQPDLELDGARLDLSLPAASWPDPSIWSP